MNYTKMLNRESKRLAKAARKANPNELRKMQRETKAIRRAWLAEAEVTR